MLYIEKRFFKIKNRKGHTMSNTSINVKMYRSTFTSIFVFAVFLIGFNTVEARQNKVTGSEQLSSQSLQKPSRAIVPLIGTLRVSNHDYDGGRDYYLEIKDVGTYKLLLPKHFTSVALMSRNKMVEVRGRLKHKKKIKVYNIKPI